MSLLSLFIVNIFGLCSKYNIMWDLPYVKLKVWVLVLPRIKPGRTGRYITKRFFWWFEIHRAYRIGQGKKSKLILWDCVGQIPGKIG